MAVKNYWGLKQFEENGNLNGMERITEQQPADWDVCYVLASDYETLEETNARNLNDYDEERKRAEEMAVRYANAQDRNAKLEAALREIADLPEEYVSGRYAHEWLLSKPEKHAVTYRLRQKAREALGDASSESK
jgi:hypothetical protein